MTKSTDRRLALAIIPHGILVGLLLGLSTSPIASIFLPLLLGVGGYRAIAGSADSSETSKAPSESLAMILGIWCLIVILSLLLGITMRTGLLPFQDTGPSTLSYVQLSSVPADKRLPIVIASRYYDQLIDNPRERRIIAAALSVPGADPLIPQLENLLGARNQSVGEATRPTYGVFHYQIDK